MHARGDLATRSGDQPWRKSGDQLPGGKGTSLVQGSCVCLAVCLLSVLASRALGADPGSSQARPRLDLNGTWQFRLDPDDKGETERWFAAEGNYPDKILVPGNWQAQGFGPAQGHLRNNYQGKAWYRRTVTVPGDWAGRRIWLHLGGTSNTAVVYVNETQIGRVEGFLTPYEFDATDVIRPGAVNTIACCVDSTGVAPVGMFNFIGRWGGLYRGVFLEARSDPAIEDLFVIPDVAKRIARVRVILRRSKADAAWEGNLAARIAPATGGGAEFCGDASVRFAAGSPESEPATIGVKLDAMRPWSPEDPFLYTVEVTLAAQGRTLDAVRDRFGMRQFTVGEGGVLLLNGQPYFLRGLGDDTVEVLTGTQQPDKKIYVDRLSLAKRYGFNGIRFLSHVPIREYFEAADEVGMLILCEGEIYQKLKEAIPLLKKQVTRIARAYRNHPSWYAFSSGNELFECQGATPDPEWMAYIRDAHKTFQELDPTRFFIGSEGADVFPTDIITQAGRFGSPPPTPDQRFDGQVADVAYFRRTLSEADLRKLAGPRRDDYAATLQALDPAGYWRPEDGKTVSLKDVAAATFAAGNAPFSVSLWIRPDGFSRNDYGTALAFGAATPGAALLIAEDGKEGFGQVRLGRYQDDFLVSNGALAARQWNHLGILHDGSVLKLYLNGTLDSSAKVRLAIVPVDGRIGGCLTTGPITETPQSNREAYDSRPHIWHEFPNTYAGPFPDLSLVEKYTGVFVDNDCIAYHRRQMAELGLAERYPEIQRRSVDLFYLYLKEHYERARRSPTMDGYNYWCFTDYPGGVEGDMTTYGMFNTLYEAEKFPDPAPILEFNRETVLLNSDGPEARVLEGGQPKQVGLAISHYGRQPIRDGRVAWEVHSQGKVVGRGAIAPLAADVGSVKPIGTIALGPFQPRGGERLRLVVRLESDVCRQSNHWDYWVFPARKPGVGQVRLMNLTGAKAVDERYGAAGKISWDQASVVLARRFTPQLLQHVAGGKTLVLLADNEALIRPREIGFYPGWIQSVGTWIEPHPALDSLEHDGFCAHQFYRLFGGVKALDTTERGTPEREKLASIVSGMRQDYDPKVGNNWSVPSNRWKFYRCGLVSEGRIGEGKILVCCFRAVEGVENGWPEAGYLLDCLVEYAASDRFRPAVPAMTTDEVKQVFRLDATADSIGN